MLLWDTLRASVDISTRTPYCSTVCLYQSIGVNTSVTHSRGSLRRKRSRHGWCERGGDPDEIPQDVCVYGELEELVV